MLNSPAGISEVLSSLHRVISDPSDYSTSLSIIKIFSLGPQDGADPRYSQIATRIMTWGTLTVLVSFRFCNDNR